jgi:hypothetical protein
MGGSSGYIPPFPTTKEQDPVAEKAKADQAGVDASVEAMRDESRRKGRRSTILAGGYDTSNTANKSIGIHTLLGG